MEAAGICREVGREAWPTATPQVSSLIPTVGAVGGKTLRDGECMSDPPPKVGALRMLPASKHRARGGGAPYTGAAAAPKTLGWKLFPL